MAQDNIHKMYERLSTRFDLGTEEQFRDYVTASTDNSKKMYERMSTRFELGSEQEWLDFMGGAKQQRETAAAKGDAEGASTFSEAEIKAETAAAEPQPVNDLPIPQTQGKSTSSTPAPGAWPYAGAYRMQDGYVVSNAPGRDTGWRLTNEDGTPRTWAENVEATKTDEQRTREQFGEHRSGMLQDLLTDHAKTKAVPSERVVVDSEGNEVDRYEVTPELSQEEAEYQARDDYYKKVKLDGERWAELEAARKQVYDEYNKELGKAHKEISELYQYVDAGAPVDIYDWVSNRREVKALKGALKYYDEALTMVKEARATNDSPNNFLGELAGLGRGLLDAGLDVSTWDMGMSDLDQGASTLSAILKLEAGKELTSAEQRLLAAAAANTYANSSLGEQMGMGYKAGQTTMMSVPFMIEMALNPASGLGSAGSKALSKHLIKKYGREMIQKQLKKRLARQTMAAKWGTKIGGDAASASVMTLTSGAAMTAADAVDRMTGTIKPTEDEEGNIVYGGRDDDYEKSVWTAARKAIGSGAIERHTEMVGGYIPAMKTAGATFLAKKMKAATNPRLRKIYREAEELLSGKAFGKWGEMVGKVADVTKLNDLAGEFFEEKIGEVENALLVGDMTFDTNSQTGIFNLDRNIETLVGLLPMQAFFGGMTALGYRTQKYRTNQALNKANKAAWETFGEDWIEMKDMIDGCETDKDLTKVVRGIISGGTTDLRSQAAVMQYVSAVQRQKGLQLVAETAPEIVAQAEAEDAAAAAMPQPTENTGAADAAAMPQSTENTGAADAAAMPQPTENGGATSQTAYDRGVAAAEADDYAAISDIGYQADLADARIERMFDEAHRAEIAEAENTEGGLEQWLVDNFGSLSAEQAFAVQALIDANDAYDGLTETVRHRTASEEEAIRQEMQPLATADGRIVPLTLDNGQTVYLKSGDPTNRRSTVIAAYRDETGAVRNTQVSGMSITSIGTEQSLSDYTLEAMSNINYERQQRIKDAMDGKNVAAGQTVRLYAGDELQEYEATAVAPEGATLRSKQDGSEMTMTTEELQDELAMSRQRRIENDLAAAMPQPTENTGATVAAAQPQLTENTEGAVTAAAQPQLTEAAKEEERRKPLRARVVQWSQDIGADIEIHEDTSSITSSAVLNQINSGQGRVRGWYDNATGKVHVYMPGITDEHDIDETVIHEIVAHKGLRQLMGPRFDALCDKVYEMMSEDARQKYLAYPGVNGDTRAAADEYMAYLAENMENLTAEEQNVWQAIVAAVREFIKSVMTGSQMTDAQIEQLIRASYLNMKAQREQTTEAAAEPQLTENTRAAAAAEREQTVEAAAQVAEKENLEEQENAEKNVSLQTKEGRMGVVARQKNSAARLAKAKEIYGSDPTTAPFFDDMDVPQTAEELVAMTLVPRSINWEGIDRGTQHIRGLQEEMGRNKKRGIGRNFDTYGFNPYLAKKGEGVGIEKLVEDIWRSDKNGMGEGNMLGDQRRFDEHEIKDALLSLLSGAQTSKDISDYVLNNRIAQAEAAIEYMEEEAAYEQELYEQERREDARLAGILELTEDDWLQMEAEYADQIAEIEAKEREQREIFQQILEQDHQQAEYYGRANQEEVASERGIRMAEESAERGTVGSAERGETVLRGAQDTRDEGLSVGDAQLSEGALGAQDGRDGRSEDVHTQEAERSDVGETEAEPQFAEKLEAEKAATNTNPTEAQKEAGNYKKGHLTFGGYKFTIENPKGSVRSGKNKKGKAWSVTMPVTYGYILGKRGKDGDHLDMFINDNADLSTWDGEVFVIDQVNPDTGKFDEHKIMYGFNDITDAIRAYLMSYTRPWKGLGNITGVSKQKFDEWVASSDRKLKPFAETRFGDKADVGTKVIRAAEERAGKRQEGETPEQDRDKQIEKAYKRGYNSYRREQYTDETLLEMYASMSNEAIEADINKMEQSIEEEKAYKDSEEYQERRSNESSNYTRAQTEGVAARAGKSVKALETNIAEAKRVLELRSMEERSAEEEEQVSFSVKPMLGNKNLTKGLRELEEGETCQVERIFTENKNFEFSSVNKVESYDDIAYIFKQLEDEAVENSFAVLVKRGKPTVIHLGMGHYTATMVNQGVLNVAVNRVKPDKIYFVHNHPSGQLRASNEDIRVWQNLWEQYGSKLANGIIINTRSGKYGIFNDERSFDIATPSTSGADSKPLKVYSFNKQVFSKDYKPEGQIFSSEDVAKFVSSHRLGDRQKLGLILTNNKEITGNIFLPYSEITTYNARAIANDIIYYTSVMGGTRAFMFGNVPLKDIRQKGISDLVAEFSGLRLLDYIEIDGGRYKSAADEGVRFSVVDDGTAAVPQYTEEEQGIVDEAKKSGTWMKAPNGKPTNLTEKQWAQVRTKAFKDWFGDWETWFKKNFLLNGTPVANLTGNEFARVEGKTLTDQVAEYFDSIGNRALSPLYGDVILDRRGADDSLAHGMGRNKAIAYASVKDVIEKGTLISYDINHKNRGYDSAIIAAPITINNERYVCEVVITRMEDNRFYLHEVTSIEKLQDAVSLTNLGLSPSAHLGAAANVLQNILSAKDSSKIVDENGEPMVVYHGTMRHNFTVFKNNGSGIYFTPDKDAADYGLDADPYAVFINMREPLNLDFEGDVDNEATENHDSLENEYKNAIAEGYDGVVAENTFDGENEMTQIVVHRPNQIKSATDNVGTFDEGNDDIRFSVANNNQEIFVSNAEQAVKGIKQEKATPQQWKAMIQSKGGLKAGEDKWLGLSEWLDEQATAKRSLTKQEVLDFIGENKIVIEEVKYGDTKYEEIAESLQDRWEELVSDAEEAVRKEYEMDKDEVLEWDWVNDKILEEIEKEYGLDIFDHIGYDMDGSFSMIASNPINSTRLEYTTKGLENKAEIALTVPTIESWNEDDEIHFGDAGEGRAVAWARFGETIDSEGNSVLVIDEIQSKRHQEGREKGYRGSFKVDEQKVKELRDELSAVRKRKKAIVPDEITGIIERAAYRKSLSEDLQAELRSLEAREQQITMEIGNLTRIPNGIPDAPFDKNWYELAMKRMLRLAAEEGFDKVAWTKGEQQAERYNIGAVLQGLKAYKTNTNKYYVIPYNNGAIGEFVKEYTEQELADTFGKELAQNIITNAENATEETPYEIVGEDLRIGGEGMKGFYDDILPRFMNKYGKKWGVKVEEVELPEVEEAGRTMWSVDVTPEMKESVMEGQVMFSVKDKNANNLVVMHNISEGDLRKVLETGGLIMPSIAITDVNIGFSGFGDISLLFDKETINPSDRRNKVYGGDAWTPRFPQLVPKLNKEKVKSVADKLYELLSKDLQDYFGLSSEVHSGNIEDNIIRGGIASYYSKDFMKIAYLLDNGKKFKVPMKPKPYGRMSEIIIRLAKEKGVSLDDINNAGYEFYENNPDFVDAIKLADAEARTQNLSSEVREKVRDMILEKPMHFSTFDRTISAARSMEYDLNNGGLKQVVDGGALYEAINKKVKTDNADYNKWVDDLFDGIIEKYGIRNNKDWYTPSGNQRSWEQLYDAATPSNILRYMIAQNTQGGSGGLFDSSIFGASAEEYKSIEEIRERGKKRLHKEESDDYDEWIESVTSRISDIKNEFLIPSERNDFRSSADANDAIVRAVAKDKTAKGIYSIMKRDYRNFTMEHAKMVADIVKEIQDKSVTYFEAKPQRIVPLSEIRKAIVPSNVDSDIIEGLRKNGIEVATYRRGNENARNRLIKKESNEIRFSFIGEQGASNLDKAEEATTRLDNLNVAREMEEARKDAKSIKMATGWERGADKKWRYEVDDKMEGIASPMDKLETLYKEYKAAEKSFDRLMETSNRLPRLPRTATEEQKAKRKEFDNRLKEAQKTWSIKRQVFMEADNRRNFTLEEILGADHELFAAYPQLKTSEVSYMDKSDYAGYSGVYMPESGNFWISPTADNPMSVLTHEIQHAIQHIEGFAQGGNTRSVQTKAETLKKDVQPLYEMIHDTPEWAEYKMLVNDYFDEYGKDQPDYDKIAEIESRLNEIEDSGVLKEIESKRKELKRKYGADATVTKILNGPFSSFDEIWEQLPSGFYDKFDAYYRLGGEVEARNAAERMGMSSEERRASLAEETEDVAREDQVFIFDGLESAAMPQSTKLSASNKAVAMYDKANGTNVKGFFNYLRNNKQAKKGEPTNFHIGNAGSLLEQYGIKGKFMVGQFTFSKEHTDNEEHHLSVNDWVNVINNLNNPLAITSYKGMPNQYRIYTYAMINGKNICVGVNVSLADGEIALSNIISAYGRDINKLLGKEKTNLIYPDIEELKRRISQVSTGHDSPLNATSTASGDKGTEKDSDLQGNEGKVSFSVRDWRKEIRDAAEANGTWLKAPNGNKSNLNRYDWVTVRGEKFKKWFGDWENGNANNPDELDANGEPLKESIDKYKTIKPIFKEGFKKWFGDWENGEVKRPDLLDSNGMPSEEAISRYVRFESFLSDEFKQWFGDWENGETNFPGLTDSDGNPKEIALTHYYKHKTIHSKSFKEWLGDWENGSARFAMVLDEDGLPYDWVVTAYRTRPKYPTKPEKEIGESQAVYFSRYRLWERAKDGYQSVADKYLDDVLNGRLEQAQSEESFIEKAQAQYEIDLAKWKEEQGIPDDATPEEEQPMPLPGERSLDYANRLTQWQRRQAAWKLAPKLENYIQAAKDDYLVYLAKYEVSKYPHSRASNIKLESAQLAKLRHAVARQKSYDKNTVQAVVDFAQQFLMQGFGDNISRGDIRHLLSAVRNATGVKDIKQNIDKIIDILVDNHIRNIENAIQKMASIKAHKMNAQNVSVQGKLELRGQRLIKAYNEARATNMTIEELENMLSSLTEKMVDADPDTAAMYSAEYDGYSLALMYAKDITESLKEYTLMRKELRDAESNRELTYREKAQLVEQLRASMLDNRVERIHRYSNFIDEFSRYLDESIEGAKDFNEAQKRHQAEIYNMAMSDLAGVSSGTDLAIDRKSESLITRLSNNPLTQFFSSPLATFEQILKLFGQKYADGRGRLYNYFMQKWAEATRNEWSGKQKQFEILDDKAREIFGGKVKRWADLYSVVDKMPGIEVSYLDVDGVRKTTKLTQGNLLYIYMANKMADGAIKLRKQGISESDMEVIEKKLDPRLKSLADWVQSDFFVESRKKYNKIHIRLFGAPMAEIENYVPIRILSDARYQEQDVARLNKDTLPSTVTGAIVNRRMNSLPLDIARTDALSLVIEHVEEMEHWAAFAEFSKDISTLLSYTPFRNKVKNMQTIYGSGDALWDRVMEVSNLAAGTYRPVVKRNTIDNAIANISKGLTLAKVAFRINTALKQLVSAIGFLHDIDIYNLFQNPFKAWNWAIKSMPQFQERWLGRKAGDTRLEDSDLDWKQWRQKFIKMSAYYGMTPNAFVDAVVSSCGAYAVYKTKYKRYKKTGYDNEQAHQKALLDAEQSFNLTQQSSKGAYIATIQADRTVAASALSVFRNSSFSFTRQSVEAFRNLRRKIGRGYKEEAISHMKRQMMLDGIPEDKAEAAAKAEYSRSIRRDLIRIVVFSYMNTIAWQLAGYWSYLLFGDDDEEKEKALTDALIRGMLAGPIEGLAGGNILSDLIGISVSSEGLTTEGLKNYRFYGLPAFSDIQKMIETFEHDQIAGLQDVINLLVQIGVGTNPETLTNSAIALIDYCNGDLDSAFELGLLLLRLNQSSSKELDSYYIDALGMSSDEIKKADFDELAKRWATYKMRQNAPMTSWMYSDERESKKMESYMKAFDKKVQERMEGLTEEQFEKNYNRSESNAERLVAIKIGGDREGLKHASKMKNAHLASYLKKSTWDDIREDMEIEKKKRELAPVNKRLEELKDSGASAEALKLFVQENTKELNLYKTIVNTLKDIRSDQEEMQNPGKQGPDELLNGIRQKRKELFEKFK